MDSDTRRGEGAGAWVMEGGPSRGLEGAGELEGSTVVAMGADATLRGSWREAGGGLEMVGSTDGVCASGGGEWEAASDPKGLRGTGGGVTGP